MYIESRLLREGKLQDFKEDKSTNPAEAAMTVLQTIWDEKVDIIVARRRELGAKNTESGKKTVLITAFAGASEHALP